MQAIIDFFVALGGFFGGIIDFVISLFEDLVWMVGQLGEVVSVIPTYIGWIPASITYLMLSIVAYIVVLRILGRD